MRIRLPTAPLAFRHIWAEGGAVDSLTPQVIHLSLPNFCPNWRGHFYSRWFQGFLRCFVAEREGFEPSLGYYPKHAFQACDLNHSSTSPREARILAWLARIIHQQGAEG